MAKTARDGAEAIDQAKAFHPHLILLDIAMPGMDGFQVARKLRDVGVGEESTIVALTGYAGTVYARRCADAGFDLDIAKPLDFNVLEELISLSHQSARLKDESARLSSRQVEARMTFIRTAIQMANTFLDVSASTTDAETKRRCIAKAQKTHRKMRELVLSNAAERRDVIAALDELKWRMRDCDSDRL